MTAPTVSDPEYRAATEGCGLVDRSERGKLALTGADAKTFLQGQVSNDVEALTPGSGCYAALLSPKGKMLADLRILDAGTELLLDTERMALQELFNVIRRFSLGYAVELHKRTLESGLLSLLGPGAAAVLDGAAVPGVVELGGTGVAGVPELDEAGVTGVAGVPELGEAEHDHAVVEIAGVAARAVRTDLGIDLLCASADIEVLTAALRDAGATAVSESTADTLRIERGRPRYGVDLDDTVIPQEADLNARAVSFTKGCYVGQETVARLYYRGKPNRQLRGLRLTEPAGTGAEVSFGDRVVGRIGSVAQSPALGPLALALVRREAPPGTQVTVGDAAIPATVVELPFAAA